MRTFVFYRKYRRFKPTRINLKPPDSPFEISHQIFEMIASFFYLLFLNCHFKQNIHKINIVPLLLLSTIAVNFCILKYAKVFFTSGERDRFRWKAKIIACENKVYHDDDARLYDERY
jgi:hypothetical protein